MDVMDLRRRLLMQMMGGKTQMVETGTYTPSEDVYASQTQILHSLGVVPDFVVVMADAFEATADMTVKYISNAYCAKSNLIASNKTADGFCAYQCSNPGRDTQWSLYETLSYTKFLKDNYFMIPYYTSNDALKAGITYHYVIGKFE